jgi:hypothetical protein
MKQLLVVLSVLSVLIISGCASDLNPRDIAIAHPIVKQFLEDHPNAEIKLTYFTENQSMNIIDEIRDDCDNQYIEPKVFYKVTVTDEVEDLSALAWMDWEEKIVICAIIESTAPSKTCSDSDGGIDYYLSGTCSECAHGSQGGGCGVTPEICNGPTTLWEYKCNNNECERVVYECPNGCENGACIQSIDCYTDGDCGTPVTNRYCSGNNACTNSTTYQCIDAGTPESQCTIAGAGGCGPCQNGCENGYCMNASIECHSDSDCGTSSTTKFCSGSNVCTNTTTYTCNNPGTVESGCAVSGGGGCGPCLNGCEDGECLEADTTPPQIVIISPANDSTVTNSPVILSVTTDEETTCKAKLLVYTGSGAGMTPWSDMESSDGLTHTKTNVVGDGNIYTFYINCTDGSGNSNEITIIFDVDLGIPPNVTITHPEHNSSVSFTPVGVSAQTTEIATCEHKAGVSFPPPECNESAGPCGGGGGGASPWGPMDETGGIWHSTTYNITDGYGYTIHVRCTDAHGHLSETKNVYFVATL